MKLLKTKQSLIILISAITLLSFGTAMANQVKIAKPETKALAVPMKPGAASKATKKTDVNKIRTRQKPNFEKNCLT